MSVRNLALVVCCLSSIFASIAASAQPNPAALRPTKPWVLDFNDKECLAERTYASPSGPVIFGIRPAIGGTNFELIIATNGRGPSLGIQRQGLVSFNGAAVRSWYLLYGVKKSNLAIHKYRIPVTDVAAIRGADTITFQADGRPPITLTIPAVGKVMDGLQQCLVLLRAHWNMDAAGTARISASPQGTIAGLFKSSDYPMEAVDRAQSGNTQFQLLIDERGRVANCYVVSTSGIPVLEVMGCTVIRERARFKAAQDSRGNAVRASIVTPPVRWVVMR